MLRLPSGLSVRVIECGDPAAPPVLLFPGWACSVYVFRIILPALAEMGYRAVSVDLKGHGLSDKPLGWREYYRDSLTNHVLEIFDGLALEKPVIGGHSLGAVMSLLVAAERPESVRGLLLYSPVGYRGVPGLMLCRALTPGFMKWMLPYVAFRWMAAITLRLTYGTVGKPVARDFDEYWAPTQFPAFSVAMRDLLHHFDFGKRDPIRLGDIRHPALVMFGTRDRLMNARVTAADAAEIQEGVVRQIPGAGHVICEETPDVVLSATDSFLKLLV
ncbi:MAG TPA: alpha/beta hydrolase [Gemmatimonadaceae bacterium]|nr:alpha/beta hydrolase [Gemmatimonadaceae bacterium]